MRLVLGWVIWVVSSCCLSLNGFQYPVASRETKIQYRESALSIGNLPFFANQFSNDKANGGEELKEGKASITTRLPLGKIFDSRDYIFSTTSNVRAYEWTQKEAEELLDDLLDASSPSSLTIDYELSQIVLIPTNTWDKERFGLGCLYDVYDGQQRIVTLCLLLRALQLSFENLEEKDLDTASELKNMLQPPKVRKENLLRIQLTPREHPVIEEIFLGEQAINATTFHATTTAQAQLVANFDRLYTRMSGLSKELRLQLLDYMIEHVHLLVCVPESAAIARNIVMGQGKGKDNEIIDDFKGLVCFRYILDEDKIYQTFDDWDDLASTEDLDNGSVGRKTVSDACLLRAKAKLGVNIGKRNQLLEMERWMRQELQARGEGATGDQFFKECIAPAALALGQFRDGSIPPFGFSKRGKITKLRASLLSRLDFLRDLTKGVTATRDIEIVLLELLLASTRTQHPMPLAEFEEYLQHAEEIALWAALVRPSASLRYKKILGLLAAIENKEKKAFCALTDEDRLEMRRALISTDFGASAGGKRFALALLRRLNAHLLTEQGEELPGASQYFLEYVLPVKATKKAWGHTWPDKSTRDAWVHRLGNLCLVSKKVAAVDSKAAFLTKKSRYVADPLPLTKNLATENEEWDNGSLVGTLSEMVNLVESIWGASGTYNEIEII